MAADGSVVFSIGADDAEAQKKLNQLRKDIEKTEKAINSTTEKRSGIAESLSQAREEAEQTAAKIQELQSLLNEGQSFIDSSKHISPEDYANLQGTQRDITAQLTQQEALYAKQSANVAKLEGQEANITSQLEAQTAKLATQKEEAGAVEATFARQSTTTMPNVSAAISEVNTNLKKGFKNILKWGFGIRSTFILIRRLRSAIKEGIAEYAKGDPETQANLDALKTSLNGLKASWGAAFAPIVNAVIPLLQKLIGWLQTAAEYVSMFFNAISGKGTYKKAIANNAALAKSYGGAGKAAKDAKKQLMGFDEINKLNAEDSGGGGGGGGSMPLADYVDEDIPDKFQKVIDYIKKNIYELEAIASLAFLAIGMILLFTWTKPLLGLGLIIAGLAMGYQVVMNWDALPEAMQKEISIIAGLLGLGLMVIGAILTFSGTDIPLGIGMMIAGGIMAGTAVALNWSKVKDFISKNIADIMVILGIGIAVLGAVLAFSGVNIPLGIALMAAGGAAFLGGVGMSINWDYVKDKVKNVIDNIKTFLDGLKQKWEEMKTAAGDFKDHIVTKFTEIKDKVKDAIDRIKEFFKFEWKLPEIKLPHITVSWEALDGNNPIAKLLGIGAIPHLAIQWYAKGGIVDGATLLGAGEAGKEAIVPLERNTEWIDMVAKGIIDGLTGNNRLADYISGRVLPSIVNGSVVPPRAISGGGSMFTDGDIQRLVNGLTAAFSEAGNEERVPVMIDGRVVAEIVTKHQRRMERGYA